MTEPERAAREYLRFEGEETILATLRCADRVAEGWDDDSTTDRNAVVEPLLRELRETGLMTRFPDLLSEAVAAAGFSLQARPVPAPPYVAVTSRGPVLRATLPVGRLVVSFRLFDVIRAEETRYVRGSNDLRSAISVELK
ncbi:hypothetical protein V5735_17870 (plasmid) [Haladaptatus sp. SPP-AMP-3]|uniref:hypothetical protein n=1 Tax=Haladaptatus sp. SPP-AMP-3 TaxID=3121295 RepID=UPI003C2F3596